MNTTVSAPRRTGSDSVTRSTSGVRKERGGVAVCSDPEEDDVERHTSQLVLVEIGSAFGLELSPNPMLRAWTTLEPVE